MIRLRIRRSVWASSVILLFTAIPCQPVLKAQGSALKSATQHSVAAHDRQCRADIEAFVEQMYQFGDPPDTAAADRMWWRAQENSHDPELLYWASFTANLGWTAAAKPGDGVALLRRAADLGYAPAIRELGMMQCMGTFGVPLDGAMGIKRVRGIADTGDPRALDFLGVAYAVGLGGLGVDLDIAQKYFQ